MSTAVPTVPTNAAVIGTDQPIDNKYCSERSERSDLPIPTGNENERSLKPLVEWLRDRRMAISTSETRHVLITPSGPLNSAAHPLDRIGTLGTLGTNSNIKGLINNQRSEQRSERSEQRACVPSDSAADWRKDEVVEPYVPVPQTIPHDIMAAGLLAASRIRPRVIVDSGQPVEDEVASTWALGVAWLRRMLPLSGFPSDRWRSVVHGCAWLLEHRSTDMRRLGWSTEDGFGVHPDAPGGAVRCYGLGILLNGGVVVEMTERDAVIERPNGVRLTFRRTARTGAVPIWSAR